MSVGQGGGIFCLLSIMDVSIHFNNQPRLVTVKASPHPASPNYDDVNVESISDFFLSYLGEVLREAGGGG
ncbi:MAG: hypothetical protein FJZ86_18050 [Chloroflexi bacterium]|nr:hypothetical protein [Chloroflexota bacterium]